jgi:hypothetical protein
MTVQRESVDARILKWGGVALFLLTIAAFVAGERTPLAAAGDHGPALTARSASSAEGAARGPVIIQL